MRIIWMVLLPIWLTAQDYGLKSLITHAHQNNPMIKATELNTQAKSKELEAAKSAFWPALDIGGSYSRVNPTTLVNPGEVTSGYATVSMELYDGGRKSAFTRAKRFEYSASLFEQEAFAKNLSLKVIDHYYTVRKLQAMLSALYGQSKELKAQLDRIRKFHAAGLATQEDIDKLVAVYENNRYTIENTKLALETRMENLRLESGLPVDTLKKSMFKEPHNVTFEPYENSKILKATANALNENANAINAGYLPQITIQDTYSRSDYDNLASSPGLDPSSILLDHQNQASVSVSMRLFDNGKMKKEKEALQYQKLALESEREYRINEQKMQFRLSQKNLQTIQAKLKSARSELTSAQSTYRAIVKKFENGLVDNIAYLDALNNQTLAKARFDETRFDYEIAKSIHYYYAGKDPKEFIQ
ncbi:TolC family protein [Sulfurovum sp. zt1-1]|uniref:TolC family protein n=1 Tax=Sulfurovum zhangzhouensis TaxID=3019067 RepID=A0ABT7QX57_9BACT|nr:TolC family protein [Sulfurovum zhangzhouensis]MDM5270921.1 TolC family protein [Sulfurovum zhangzhouensis]